LAELYTHALARASPKIERTTEVAESVGAHREGHAGAATARPRRLPGGGGFPFPVPFSVFVQKSLAAGRGKV
jgi:hypothetical protein